MTGRATSPTLTRDNVDSHHESCWRVTRLTLRIKRLDEAVIFELFHKTIVHESFR